MVWLAVDENGDEYIYDKKPYRQDKNYFADCNCVLLPFGTIEKIIGKKLTWQDESVEI